MESCFLRLDVAITEMLVKKEKNGHLAIIRIPFQMFQRYLLRKKNSCDNSFAQSKAIWLQSQTVIIFFYFSYNPIEQ